MSPEKMDTTPNEFEFDSLSDSLPPLPHSDFTSSFTFSDLLHKQHEQINSDSFLLNSIFFDSSLSLLNHNHLTESTHFQHLLHENNIQFLHLPALKSIDQTTTTAFEETKTKPFLSLSSPDLKRRRKILGSSSSPIENNVTRRKKISDKIRSLEKIMPWEIKLSLAMVLEESYKYIKFLQSQIDVLRWMPLESVYNTTGEVGETDLLKSLTRQQILQVLANSRNLLVKRGVCVSPMNNLLSLKTMSRNL